MLNVLVLGQNGQVGNELKVLSTNYDYNFFFTDRTSVDICNFSQVKEFIKKNNINIIINASAYTAVDKAEKDKQLADDINHKAIENLASLAKKFNLKLVHISTDYIFNGKNYKPYVEDDSVEPQGVYGETKLLGEQAIQKINPTNSIIIRTSWVYSSFGNNFVKTMLKLGKERDALTVIFDQVGTPTYARDLAKTILEIIPQINNEKVEIYHYSNEGVLSWYDFAKEIMKMAEIECKISPIETKDYPTPASRPHYSLLNKSKIKTTFNIDIPYWKDSLSECLNVMDARK